MVKDVAVEPAQPAPDEVVFVDTVGFVRRAVAAGIDGVPVFTLWALAALGWTISAELSLPPSRWNAVDRFVDLTFQRPELLALSLLLLVTILVSWHVVWERLMGASLGKRILGLRVIDERGRCPSVGRSVLCGLLRVASGAALGAGHLWALVDPEGRTIHDRISGTYVVGGDPEDALDGGPEGAP